MPLITRVAIRLALLHLLLGLGAWATLPVAAKATDLPVLAASPAVWHLLAVGWLTQLILGVAFWLFPTHKEEPKRGNEKVAWTGIVALNLGLVLRVVFEPAFELAPTGVSAGLGASAILQVVAVLAWLVVLWPRVRGK